MSCPPGYYSHTTPGSDTSECTDFCLPGFTDHDNDVSTPCHSCLPGYYADSVGRTGECTACRAGRFNDEQGADSNQYCEPCGQHQYSQPGSSACELAADFFACLDPGRQWSDFERLHISTSEGTRCTCRPGYYDAARVEIRCWKYDRKDDPADDVFNRDSLQDEAMRTQFDGADLSNWASTCVACLEDCVDCSRGSDWSNITIKEGFGLAAPQAEMPQTGRTTVDIFKCPLDGACLANLSFAHIFAGQDRLCDESSHRRSFIEEKDSVLWSMQFRLHIGCKRVLELRSPAGQLCAHHRRTRSRHGDWLSC